MIDNYGGIGAAGSARRGHLALVVGGSSDVIGSTTGNARMAATSYVRGGGQEGVRGRQSVGVRAVARQFTDPDFTKAFTAALPAMVRATGVSSKESVQAVTDAIMNHPTLRAQAERAFRAAQDEQSV